MSTERLRRAASACMALLRRNAVPVILVTALCDKQVWLQEVVWRSRPLHLALATLAGPGAVAAIVVLVPAGRARACAAVGADALVSLILFVDLLHFRAFGALPSVGAIAYAPQLRDQLGAIAALVRRSDLLLFVDIPFLALAACHREFACRAPRVPWLASTSAAVVLLIARDGSAQPRDCFSDASRMARVYGVLGYHALDVDRYGRALVARRSIDPALLAGARSALDQRVHRRAPGRFHGVAPRANVVIVQVESLQAFAFGLEIDGEPVTPALSALARESVVFTRFFHQAGAGRTSDADFLMNCSSYPAAGTSVYFQFATNTFRCLPGVLRESGYRTLAVQGATGEMWNLRNIYPRLGYDEFLSLERLGALPGYERDGMSWNGLGDEALLNQAATLLESEPEPFLAYVTTLTSHEPYPVGDPTFAVGRDGAFGKYLRAIHYTDARLGAFVGRLRASGLLDRTLLVVYGDHDGLRPDDLVRENAAGDDPVSRFEAVRRVPLLMRFPAGALRGVVDEPRGEIDLAPTIAGAVGIETTHLPFLGAEVGSVNEAPVVFPTGDVRARGRAYLSAATAGGTAACFAVDGAPAPDAHECDALRTTGERELSEGRQMLETDVHAMR